MRLTDQQCWRYDTVLISRRAIETVRRRDEWLTVIRRTLPGGALRYLELGCAPGLYTAALAEGTQWDIFGIDYSDDAELFIETLSIVGKQARLHRADMFNQRIDGRFDIV